jgi:hypothetical protein
MAARHDSRHDARRRWTVAVVQGGSGTRIQEFVRQRDLPVGVTPARIRWCAIASPTP